MIKHQGGCHCGNIKFTTKYDPMLVMACHCRSCSKISGVGMTVFAVFGEGEIDFVRLDKILNNKFKNIPFIPEIWQGHKNKGQGFWEALYLLEGKI